MKMEKYLESEFFKQNGCRKLGSWVPRDPFYAYEGGGYMGTEKAYFWLILT